MEDGIISDAENNDPNSERIGDAKLDVCDADRMILLIDYENNQWIRRTVSCIR